MRSIASRGSIYVGLLGLVLALFVGSSTAAALEPPYEADPTLSLFGNCNTSAVDPIPDPSCSGDPLSYPAPPNGPTGQFSQPRGIAIDLAGNQYVASFAAGDDAKGRVDVFDDEGRFITEFAAPDIQTAAVDSEGNFYAFRNTGDVVRYSPTGEYKPEEGEIEYGGTTVLLDSGFSQGSVAVDLANDQVLIAREKEITRYKSAADAEPNGFLASYEPEDLGPWSEAMVVDAQRRRIYVTYCASANEECGVKVLDADNPEEELEEIDGSTTPAGEFVPLSGRLPVAVDEGTGDFFIADGALDVIYRFSESYEFLSELNFSELESSIQIAVSNGTRSLSAEPCDYPTNPPPAAGDACNRHYLYVPVFKTQGRLAAFHPPAQKPPVIETVSTPSIGETEAELRAKIFPGGLETTYHFEITTQADYEASEWSGATSLGEGTIAAESLAKEVSVFATGLTSGETYRFRVVADNDLGPGEEEGQNEAVFTTYNDATISSGCSNEALRVGPSALLPDCRAYELVTPADTNGRAPKGTGFLGSIFPTLQASPAGEAVSFRIEGGSLPGSSGVGSFNGGDPYVARRGASGWSSELAGATGAEVTNSAPGSVSPDQNYAFWRSLGEGPLGTIGAIYNEYFYYPDGHSELIGRGSEGVDRTATGKLITENATHVIFTTQTETSSTPVKLEPDAPPNGTFAIYDRTIDPVTGDEETHTVSLLPGDVTPNAGENAFYQGASKDGEGIAFEISTKPSGEEGVLYFRVGNETTYEIGEDVEFAGISEGAERIFYVENGNFRAFDVASDEVIDFAATGDAVPVNVATDGARAYFVSEKALGGANPLGEEAQANEQNLYLSEEGTISFVATVTERDVDGEPEPFGTAPYDGLGLWTEEVGDQVARDPSRTNPDGSVLLFQSRADITGYPESEFPQIYRYSTAGDLQCISCIPTGVAATGGAALESYTFDTFTPKPFSPAGFVPNLNPAGTRVFFDSTEALVSTDSDEVTDVYEWEANGVGSCTRPEGCVYLISSGQSERDNYLYGHSTSGDDVFFTTTDQLTAWDSGEGALSIYDARVGGGFPPPVQAIPCSDDGCRPQVSPVPNVPAPAVPARGADDQVKNKPKTCPKGKRKVKKNGKVRCVKKKQKGGKDKQRASADRRAGK
ncbi:MAG TPA: hypothetical protein VFR75_10230 [Solirubrobacterales bacterium]|nr:hypothetical protein [Solirubrobacterales bacterium]